ncbi:MAG TPA: hypothetical protein VIA98_08415 [Allosphingosinicella sp.]|jgi:hypothetical protein
MSLLALMLALTAPPADVASQPLRAAVDASPKAVAKFIARRANCNHFLGEEPYDKARAAELNKAIRELRCGRIDRDERRLRVRYAAHSTVLRLLEETSDLLGW